MEISVKINVDWYIHLVSHLKVQDMINDVRYQLEYQQLATERSGSRMLRNVRGIVYQLVTCLAFAILI